MLAFMAYPVAAGSTSGPVRRADGSAVNNSRRLGYATPTTTAATAVAPEAAGTSTGHQHGLTVDTCGASRSPLSDMDHDGPPLSILSISTEGSSSQPRHVVYQLQLERDGDVHDIHHNNRNILNHSVMDDDNDDDDDAHVQEEHTKNRRHTPFMEQLYENTVDGPCQTVTLCEVQHMDLFLNCQQPLSFLGFGALPHSHDRNANTASTELELSYHLPPEYYDADDSSRHLLPGAYAFPRGCEYCGAHRTSECRPPPECSRPRLYMQKKRPPFAAPDPNLWDPETDEALPTRTKTKNGTLEAATATTTATTTRMDSKDPLPPRPNKVAARPPPFRSRLVSV